MPCSDGQERWWERQSCDATRIVKEPPDPPECHPDYQVLVRLACDRCKELEARGGDAPVFAQEWWTRHKAKDEKEKKESEAVQRYARIRAQALAKLTQEEKRELGFE